jgi:hypothetical protein
MLCDGDLNTRPPESDGSEFVNKNLNRPVFGSAIFQITYRSTYYWITVGKNWLKIKSTFEG